MSKEELSFEELPDGSKIITIKGINQFGEKYIRQERIKCPSVWDALKRLTYTADDMEAFAEFLIGRNTAWITELERNETAKTLIELWEKEMRKKED